MSCNNCNNNCNSDCGCLNQVGGNCVFYQGSNLLCLDVTKGDDYDTILGNLNSLVCGLTPPSGTTYVGTPDQIDVVGDTISLSPTVTTQITNLESNVSGLQSCTANTVKAITTTPGSGLTASVTSTNSCGKTINLNYTPAAIPLTQKQGIVYNIITAESNVGAGVVKTHDLTSYGLVAKDQIEINLVLKTTNSIPVPSTNNLINVYNGINPLTGMYITDGGGFYFSDIYDKIITDVKIVLTVTNTTTNKMNGKIKMLSYGALSADVVYSAISSMVYERITAVNDITVPLNSIVVEFNNTFPSNTTLEQYTVEIKRKI